MGISGGPDIIQDGLVLNLDASDKNSYPGSGTTWFDMSGNGYNATLYNGPTFNSTNGGVIIFDGIGNYASINVNSWIRSNSTAYTFSSFFYYNGSSSGGAPYSLLTYPNVSGGSDGFWQHLNLGPWYWRLEDSNVGETGGIVENPSTFSNSTWYHEVTVVKTNELSFYRNGSLISTIATTFSWANLIAGDVAYLYLATGYGENYYMNGYMANFQMYNRVLSSAEVLQNYNAQKSRFNL